MDLTADNIDTWLDEKFFQKVIENHLKLKKDDYQFQKIDIEPATKKGDNYLSVMLRAKIEIKVDDQVKNLKYIVKTLLKSALLSDWIDGFEAFPKEQKLYSEIIPALEKLWESIGIEVNFGPKCYYVTNDPIDIIVMEDLEGYQMPSRVHLLNEKQSEMIMDWQAKFHASSLIYYGDKGPQEEFLHEGLYKKSMIKKYEEYYQLFFDYYLKAVQSITNGDYFADKIKKWRHRTFESVINAIDAKSDYPKVLNHGDQWVNNLMYKYDADGIPIDIKLVDYQLSFWGSPAVDIWNIIISSFHEDFKVEKFDQMIKRYHDTFVESLKKLNYDGKIPSLKELHEELARKSFVGAAYTIEGLSISMFPSEVIDGNEYYEELLSNPRYLKALDLVFPFLDSKNGLDVIEN